MAVLSGRNGSLKLLVATASPDGIDGSVAAGATTALGNLRSWSIDSSANLQTVDTASMGNFDDWTQTFTVSRSWSASFAGLWDAADELADTIQVGANAAIILYPDNGTQTISYSGSGVIDSVTINASYDGMVEISFSIQGSGALGRDLD
jgi:hypothetical protein